nr:SMI1/KNR4 family protein [Polyangiaceae bacterium]
MTEALKRLRAWLDANAAALASTLLPRADDEDIDALERAVGVPLPPAVREGWLACGGQLERDGPGVMADFVLLSPRDALAEWKQWETLRRESTEELLDDLDNACRSEPRGVIQEKYSVPGWVPLWKEPMEGNYLGVDLDPGETGVVGQVIAFGRDEDEKRVLFWDYAAAVKWLADAAEHGALVMEDGRLVHRDGRVLSVLRSQAEAGAIPTGKKPRQTKKPKAKTPAKKAPKHKGPEPNPESLPGAAQGKLEEYLTLVREQLLQHAADLPQSCALSRQELDDPRKPLGSPVTGSALSMLPWSPPIDADDQRITGAFRQLMQLTLEQGVSLYQIEICFERDGNGAWAPAVALETAENRKRLNAARKAFDLELAAALVSFMNAERPDWEKASLAFDADPKARRSGLHALKVFPRPLEELPPSPDLGALFDRVHSLHGEFGRWLYNGAWSVDRKKPDKPEVRAVHTAFRGRT